MSKVIDYGSGNLRSVFNALIAQGADVEIIATPERLSLAEAVVLPGVGAFGDCVQQIRQRGFWEPLQEWIAADRPFLGICVGYQVLFEGSEESPGELGMGVFKGQVRKFATPSLKVPQIGWNSLDLTQTEHPLWRGLPTDPYVYFVHSYYPEVTEETPVIARSTYGETFAAAASRGRVSGVQFHPEKSQSMGLRILSNFLQLEAKIQ
ncbi:MAG: imidazole glycerol phosphate synthase subunit HisH [Proteobacteria bacterium]|nr:imidazole glycerol phosphate synthase subunit HisH [Pseudomonadota bacterium]